MSIQFQEFMQLLMIISFSNFSPIFRSAGMEFRLMNGGTRKWLLHLGEADEMEKLSKMYKRDK